MTILFNMKKYSILLVVVLLGMLSSCVPMEDERVVVLSFWTDREVGEKGFTKVYVNDIYLGEMSEAVENPVCGLSGLVNYSMSESEDLHLTVRNDADAIKEIGVVNLYSVSTGVKIRPDKDAEIFVYRELDDECTLIYLNWK